MAKTKEKTEVKEVDSVSDVKPLKEVAVKAGMRALKSVKVQDELYEKALEKAEEYVGGIDALIRNAVAKEVGLTIDLITVNLDDLPNRNMTITAKVSLDTMHSISAQADQANVENTEFAGEILERFASSSVIAKGQIVPEYRTEALLKAERLGEELFQQYGDESQSYEDFADDIVTLGVQAKEFELKNETSIFAYIEGIETRLAQYENPDAESKKKAVIIQLDQIGNDDVKNELISFGFNEDKYMTHERESKLQGIIATAQKSNDETEKKQGETIEKLLLENKQLINEQTEIINASVKLVEIYQKSVSFFGIWRRRTPEELASLFPQRYRHLFK